MGHNAAAFRELTQSARVATHTMLSFGDTLRRLGPLDLDAEQPEE